MSHKSKSPFEYTSPEAIPANDIIDLFVPVFGEYYNLPSPGHTFIHGPRGSGKSMMFRYMTPECQILANKCSIKELSYFAVLVPIKEGRIKNHVLEVLKGRHFEYRLNEHYMVINILFKILEKLELTSFEDSENNYDEVLGFYNDTFVELLELARWTEIPDTEDVTNSKDLFVLMKKTMNKINMSFTFDVLNRLSENPNDFSYRGSLCLFNEFLIEFVKELKKLSFMPKGPVYLMIDDADNLSITQTKVLNTWVSLRTSKFLSFKISTQLNYSTYRTVNNSRIDTPHDYSFINLSDIYTTKKGLYRKRVKEAVERRLQKYKEKHILAEDFFPLDKGQEIRIKKKFKEYESKFEGKKGYDFAYRYTTPDYIKELGGNRDSYSYAGFDSLVNISSGIIRNFLDFAHKMYVHQLAKHNSHDFDYIDPGVQNTEVKDYSSWFLTENFDELRDDEENTSDEKNDFDKLGNLISALGQTFSLILLSDAKERRVFSIALQDDPDSELKRVLDLGVRTGYFHKSLIGNKTGTGKARLYILSRLLSPHYRLDPTSFAGYKFVTCNVLKEALVNPKKVVGKIIRKGVDNVLINPQQSLFKELEQNGKRDKN